MLLMGIDASRGLVSTSPTPLALTPAAASVATSSATSPLGKSSPLASTFIRATAPALVVAARKPAPTPAPMPTPDDLRKAKVEGALAMTTISPPPPAPAVPVNMIDGSGGSTLDTEDLLRRMAQAQAQVAAQEQAARQRRWLIWGGIAAAALVAGGVLLLRR